MGRYGQSSLQDHTPEAGYLEGPAEETSEKHPRPDLVSSSSKLKRNAKQNKKTVTMRECRIRNFEAEVKIGDTLTTVFSFNILSLKFQGFPPCVVMTVMLL